MWDDFNISADSIEELKIILKNPDLRLKVYKFILNELKTRKAWTAAPVAASMCSCCPDFIKHVFNDNINIRLRVLPELWKKKPYGKRKKYGGYWYASSDFDTRIKILTSIIEKLSIPQI